MIISCSTKALQAIQQACANRIGKKDVGKIVFPDKAKAMREAIEAHPLEKQFVWNLDLETLRVVDDEGRVSGYLTLGFLHNVTYRCTVILNGLDDADLCHIGTVAKQGIKTVFDDFDIVPQATDAYLSRADEFERVVREATGELPNGFAHGSKEKALVIPNGDRSATASLNHAKSHYRNVRFGERSLPEVFTDPVDRTGCFYLNNDLLKRKDSSRNCDTPLMRTRNSVLALVEGVEVPAVKLRLQLIEDGYPCEDAETSDGKVTPEMYRDVVVPLFAPLSWLHQVIQKTMFWADYHLHRFQFLDHEARKMLEHAFKSLFSIEDWDGVDAKRRGVSSYNLFESEGEESFVHKTRMSLRWLYQDFLSAMEHGGELEEDFPNSYLPENGALGLYLLGSSGYQEMTKKAEAGSLDSIVPEDDWALYYNYDFGDDWEISITPLEYFMADVSTLPGIVDACGHTPPEDVGGLNGYEEFVTAFESGNTINSDGTDLEEWARDNGWQPFEGLEKLKNHFDQPSTWEI